MRRRPASSSPTTLQRRGAERGPNDSLVTVTSVDESVQECAVNAIEARPGMREDMSASEAVRIPEQHLPLLAATLDADEANLVIVGDDGDAARPLRRSLSLAILCESDPSGLIP